MSDKVVELSSVLSQDGSASWITNLWTNYKHQMAEREALWQETKQYIFATDTSQTSNSSLDWEHTTTLPKLCQIRDNLYANYMSALFPNDKWLKWEGYSKESANKDVARTITGYMENKTREGGFRDEVSKMVYDYIDYGNAFSIPSFESRHNMVHGEHIPGFIGPKGNRISPDDIVFNPLATSIENSFKIIRTVKTIGELLKLAETNPDQEFWKDVIEHRFKVRELMSGMSTDDFHKSESYSIDGFGNLQEYYQSEYVEILEFYGDFHEPNTNTLQTDRMITVVDRGKEVRNVAIPTYSGRAPIRHVGWRKRPDNLWAMSPLENLVGLQYMIDHLQNSKADATDMAINSPLAIVGEVEPFVWGPKAQVHFPDGEGQVGEISKNLQPVIAAENQIQLLEDKMELFAGAPREAAGIRTPGEKTAFEVDSLQTAAGRIFQEKITAFEIGLLEPLLNDMLETAHRNFDEVDVIRTIDNDLGVVEFKEITKDDITAKGILRPVGARHFAQKAKELQNLIGIFNVPTLYQTIAPHVSGLAITDYIEDSLDIRGYDIFRPNVAIAEQQETASLANQAGEDMEVEQSMDIGEDQI
jgi:hypothetical protein